MNYLVVYDSTGKIYYQAAGAVTEPTGIPFLWVDVPDGQHIVSVDVSGDTPVAVLADNDKSQVELVEDEVTELQYLVAQMGGGLNG